MKKVGKRIVVVGTSGSGKTTLARRLVKINLPSMIFFTVPAQRKIKSLVVSLVIALPSDGVAFLA